MRLVPFQAGFDKLSSCGKLRFKKWFFSVVRGLQACLVGKSPTRQSMILVLISLLVIATSLPLPSLETSDASGPIHVSGTDRERKIVILSGWHFASAPWKDPDSYNLMEETWWDNGKHGLIRSMTTSPAVTSFIEFMPNFTDDKYAMLSFPYACLRDVNREEDCPETDFLAFSYGENVTKAIPEGFYYYMGDDIRKHLNESALVLDKQIQAYINHYPEAEFDIIGHSLGGIVACYWASQVADQHKLDKIHSIITLDSPLKGYPLLFLELIAGPIGDDVGIGGKVDLFKDVGEKVNLVTLRSGSIKDPWTLLGLNATLDKTWRDLWGFMGSHSGIKTHPRALQEVEDVVTSDLFDDANPAVQANGTGSWSTVSSDAFIRGAELESNTKDDTVSLTFNGSGIIWYTSTGSNRGYANVWIDDTFQEKVNLHSFVGDPKHPMHPKYPFAGLDPDIPHTITISVTGEKKWYSLGTYVTLDAFEVKAPLIPVPVPPSPVINKGLEYLRQQHANYPNRSWRNDVGITALAVLSFLNAGYDESDQDVHDAIQYILSNVKPDGRISNGYDTYHTSLAILPLIATHNSDYNDEVDNAKNWLINAQSDETFGYTSADYQYGGWTYGSYKSDPDLSNTQWALLGLDAAGLPKSDPTWTKAITYLQRCQNRPASNDQAWAHDDTRPAYNDGWRIHIPAFGVESCWWNGFLWKHDRSGYLGLRPLWVRSHGSEDGGGPGLVCQQLFLGLQPEDRW